MSDGAPGPMPVVPTADLDRVPEPVVACPRCGYLGIRPVRGEEGAVPGASDIMSERLCPRCEYRGIPVEFRTRDEYVAFLGELNES